MTRLWATAFSIFLLAISLVYLAFSKTVDIDSQEFKLKTILLQIKADAWDSKALLDAGKKNYQPQSGTPDFLNALHFFQKAAVQSNAEAEYYLSLMYRDGKGVAKDNDAHLKLMQKASDHGFGQASYELAERNLASHAADSKQQGVEWLIKAADQGNMAAAKKLADSYMDGILVEQNYIEALKYAKKLADAGNSVGKLLIGKMHYYGYGTAKDEKLGRQYLEEAFKSGSMDAAAEIGAILYGAKDYNAAEKYFKIACEKKNPDGCYWCAELYSAEGFSGRNLKIAIDYAFKAASLGDGRAYLILGNAYWDGVGVSKDETEAVKWYKKSAGTALKEGQYYLGLAYYYGKVGGKPNYQDAARYFEMAADQGHLEASSIIGIWYESGTGVAVDHVKGYKYLKFALDGGITSPNTQFWFGDINYRGLGVEKNLAAGFAWYKKAADQGYAIAANNVGYAYANGEGVNKDGVQAIRYYYQSIIRGYKDAAVNIAYYYHNEKYFADAVTWFYVAERLGYTVDKSAVYRATIEDRTNLTVLQYKNAIANAEKFLKRIQSESQPSS